jgi:hypothetical protein
MRVVFSLISVLVIIGVFMGNLEADGKSAFGFVEKVRIYPGDLELTAKLDTGADHSSLNVSEYEEFTRDGQKWVRFTIETKKGENIRLEQELVRMVKIKRHKGKSHVRPVVKLWICVGNIQREAQVNLYDRSRFKYSMLIGRSFMDGLIVVDPSMKMTSKPQCKKAEKP